MPAADAEDRRLGSGRVLEVAHVLDDAEDRHANLAEHLHALAGVDEADLAAAW